MDFAIAGDFDREPQLDRYVDLVRAAAALSQRALLMTREHSGTDETDALLDRLQPWCLRVEERSYWPNTSLHPRNVQIIHEFSLSPEVVVALGEVARGLYGWGHLLPEDLAFVRDDGSVVLYSTTHEEEAGLCLSNRERERLEAACPWLGDFVTWRTPTKAEIELRQAGG